MLTSAPTAQCECNSPAAGTPAARKPAAKKTNRTALAPTFAEALKINRSNKLITRYESVLCPNLLQLIAEDAAIGQEFWETAQECRYLHWVLPTTCPGLLGQIVPPDWGPNGYSNVTFAIKLDSGIEASREQLLAFRKLPARFRAIWLEPLQSPVISEDWHLGVHWVIADSSGCTTNGLISSWVQELRETCDSHGIPFFHNAAAGSHCPLPTSQEPLLPEHPFSDKIDLDLHRACLLAKKKDVTDRSIPSSDPAPSIQPEAKSTTNTALLENAGLAEILSPEPCSLVVIAGNKDVAKENPDARRSADVTVIDVTVVEAEVVTRTERFGVLDKRAHQGIRAPLEGGLALIEIRDRELWRDGGYNSWAAYCGTFLETDKSYVNKVIRGAEIREELCKSDPPKGSDGVPILPENEAQTRPLAKLRDAKQRSKAWKLVIRRSGHRPTSAIVASVVSELLAAKAPPKAPSPGRKERRHQLLDELRRAAEAGQSLEAVLELIDKLKTVC